MEQKFTTMAQEALQRGGRDLADRGVLVSEVRSRPAVGDRRVQLQAAGVKVLI